MRPDEPRVSESVRRSDLAAETRLAELLDRWEDAFENGEELDPQQLCADCPELAEELVRQIAALKSMDARLFVDSEIPSPAASQPPRDSQADVIQTRSSYRSLQRLARGGLGVVYRARDGELHRDVVLKFIQRRIAGNEERQQMFRREAEVTSRLDHPGVVPVYGIGHSEDGRIFYAMRYIQGETLDEAIDQLHDPQRTSSTGRELLLRKLLSHFVTVCKTIAYAHNRGILHRDIKPANIMLGRFGETLVVDWGLATSVERDGPFKLETEKTLLLSDDESTDHGAGTPAYMSPEATSQQDELSPAADIYSLGATLYKLLTGRTAFAASSLAQLRHKIVAGEFPAPRKVTRGVSRALEAVCLKAMATQPQERYATALDLAADVENYLADAPVSAYAEPLPRRFARWARRHRTAAQAIIAGITALCLVTILSAIWLGYLARREHGARVAAEAAQRASLRMSAKFAARTIASQIDLRWRILEAAAKDRQIAQVLADINPSTKESPDKLPAQAWLNEQFIELQQANAVGFDSLFLLDASGIQVARTPQSDSIGKSYAFRDYYHGSGYDLPQDEELDIEPIRDVNLSAIYVSSTSGKLKVAFTVPVIDRQTAPWTTVGVLGMSVELGEFGVLKTDLQDEQVVVLIDSRTDALDGQPQRGLVLQHPELGTELADESSRLEPTALDQITQAQTGLLMPDYRDPLAGGQWIAAAEPVIVYGRRNSTARTGWIVLVQKQAPAE